MPFAEKGVLVHLNSQHYAQLVQSKNRPTARQQIKILTAHNGKLGFNWKSAEKVYAVSLVEQYPSAGYKEALTKAAQFHNSNNNAKYGQHLASAANMIGKKTPPASGMNSMFVPVSELDQIGFNNQTDQRPIKGYTEKIEKLE